MTYQTNQGNDQLFNNPDSFAMVFDEQWKYHNSNKCMLDGTIEEKLEFIFEKIEDHPFLISHRDKAMEIAKFRIRLLNLS